LLAKIKAMVNVRSYIRYTQSGGHRVRSHNRKVKHKRGDYNIERWRQLPPARHAYETDFFWDRQITAETPGKRKSKNNNTYYERRFNRSDGGSNYSDHVGL
jgi:hypothetical protein